MPPSDDLARLAGEWLAAHGAACTSVEPLAGDVSARRYARAVLTSGETVVLACYPPDALEAGDRFRRTAELLWGAGVRVPAIRAWDPRAGIMWLEDVGDRSLYEVARSGGRVDGPRARALAVARRIARLAPEAVAAINPRLDGAALRGELEQSWRLVLAPRGLTGEGALGEALRRSLAELCDRLDEATPRPCHRDFMARNLMLDGDDEPIVIDHQDLRLGPPWYDLASLLNDSVYATAEEEAAALRLARVPRPQVEDYHRAAAQRALKIVGTFTAFAERGAPRHLPLVLPSLRAARRHLLRLPETADVLRALAPAWDRELAGGGEPPPPGLC